MLRKAVLCALMLAGMNAFAVSGENIKDYMSKRKVIVNTSKAELCFADEKKCHPVLIGKTTPKGTFSMNIYKTDKAGYGGDVIGFKQEKDFLFALHRVWTLKPSERRMERIASPVVSDRIITNGCINVTDKVYDKLRQYFVLEVI